MNTKAPPIAALGTDFQTASSQIRVALVARGLEFTPRPSRQGLHIHRTGRTARHTAAVTEKFLGLFCPFLAP